MSIDKFNECWGSIETWLNVSANILFNSLNPPATANQLSEIESYYQATLPADFIALYQQHNGQDTSKVVNLFYGQQFLSIQEGLSTHQGMVADMIEYIKFSEFEFVSAEISKDETSPLSKYPIAGGIDAYGVFIDFKPSEKGKYGQIVFLDFESLIAVKVADSVTDMACVLSSGLKSGAYTLNTESHMEVGAWLDPPKKDDLANWRHYHQDNLPSE